MVASYLESYRRAGISMSQDQVEKQVVADCELVDAARRHGEIGGAKPKRDERQTRPDVVEAAQRATGTRLTRGEQQYDRFRFLDASPQATSERWGFATARLYRILEGVGKSSNFVTAVKNAEYPALAQAAAELWMHWLTRGMPAPSLGVDHNPFRGLSNRDASRVFMRLVEDICDRSTGVLGPWYTK